MCGLSGARAGASGPGERGHPLEVQMDPGELGGDTQWRGKFVIHSV